MQLHCLGTAGYHPNETRQTSCYFLPDSGILLDAGTGLFRLAEHLRTETLDILITHAHLDHIAGLTFLIDVLYQRPVDRIRIWGEGEKLEAIREHLFAPLIFPVPLQAEWMPIDSLPLFRIGDCEVSWRHQQHPGGSVGYRLEWADGPRLLYLTDTTGDVSAEAAVWNADADLMMHECYFSQEYSEWAEKTGHTATHRAAEIATAARPKKLLLTHANPLAKSADELLSETEAKLGSPIETLLAEDGLTVEFG